jgi:hypothetical protein
MKENFLVRRGFCSDMSSRECDMSSLQWLERKYSLWPDTDRPRQGRTEVSIAENRDAK